MGPFRSSATRRLAAVALAVTSLVACGADQSETSGSATGRSAAGATAETPLAFEHALVGGGTIDFEALAGQPTALWFWAPY